MLKKVVLTLSCKIMFTIGLKGWFDNVSKQGRINYFYGEYAAQISVSLTHK